MGEVKILVANLSHLLGVAEVKTYSEVAPSVSLHLTEEQILRLRLVTLVERKVAMAMTRSRKRNGRTQMKMRMVLEMVLESMMVRRVQWRFWRLLPPVPWRLLPLPIFSPTSPSFLVREG